MLNFNKIILPYIWIRVFKTFNLIKATAQIANKVRCKRIILSILIYQYFITTAYLVIFSNHGLESPLTIKRKVIAKI